MYVYRLEDHTLQLLKSQILKIVVWSLLYVSCFFILLEVTEVKFMYKMTFHKYIYLHNDFSQFVSYFRDVIGFLMRFDPISYRTFLILILCYGGFVTSFVSTLTSPLHSAGQM